MPVYEQVLAFSAPKVLWLHPEPLELCSWDPNGWQNTHGYLECEGLVEILKNLAIYCQFLNKMASGNIILISTMKFDVHFILQSVQKGEILT